MDRATQQLLVTAAARSLAYWLAYWARHCWRCEGEYDRDALLRCPHCGADAVPF